MIIKKHFHRFPRRRHFFDNRWSPISLFITVDLPYRFLRRNRFCCFDCTPHSGACADLSASPELAFADQQGQGGKITTGSNWLLSVQAG